VDTLQVSNYALFFLKHLLFLHKRNVYTKESEIMVKVTEKTRRGKSLIIRVSEPEMYIIEQRAKEKGKDVAKFVRDKAIGSKLPKRFSSKNVKTLERLMKKKIARVNK